MAVPHPKRGEIIWTCVKDNFIGENDEYKEIGTCAFDYKSFEEKEGGGFEREYLKHLIKLLTGYWEDQLGDIHE